MATIAVNIVLEKLASLAAEEARLLGGVRAGVDQLRDDLDSMKSFLQDAEAISESDEGLKTWVKQVRDVAYDAEDVIEEFLLHFAPPSHHGLLQFARSFHHQFKRLKARHQLAVQIESIKGRVEAISKRRTAFSFNLGAATSSDSTLYTWHDPRRASLYLDEADVVGIENPKSLLVKWLVEGEMKLTAISVVGMGGLGKTTLVKKAFDCEPVNRSFDCLAWVTVSKSFTVAELLRAALLNFLKATKKPPPEGIESMVDFQLIELLSTYLQQKRYVIVFDDVWSVDVWEAMKYALPDCNCGSRIIFTSRLIDVAESVENAGHVYHLQPLPKKEAWTLFCRKALREVDGACPEELKAMSESILKKCEGLPLAIVAIGGLLSRKHRAVSEWKKVHDSLAAEMKRDGNLGSLERILLLSYNDLPYNLKMCYLYLSVFPEDYLIKRTKLIRLWSAERFVEGKQGLTLEEVAEDYLNELVNRSMIQVVEMGHFGRVRTCRIHDLLREIIQTKSSEESLVMIAGEKSMTKIVKVRRLSIHESCSDSLSDAKFHHLRSLLLFLSTGSSTTSLGGSFFSGCKLLHVLELEAAPLSIFPPELTKLVHLRYLSLRRTQIQEIPKSIRKLKQLETLDLKGTSVSSLPAEILQLTRLREIRIYHYRLESSVFLADSYGITVPSGIGSLTSLQKLGSVQVKGGDGELIRELGQLNQLKRLGIIGLERDNGRDLCYCLERLKHLTSLYMVSARSSDSLQLDSLSSPPQFLQSLYLKCILETFPNWIASLHNLTKLVLERSELKNDPLHALQDLQSLVVLELRQAYDGEEMCCEARGFPRLKKLCLHELESVKRVRVGKGAMPELSELDIVSCRELMETPLGTEHLYKLKLLLLCDMPRGFLEKIKRVDGEDFWKVEHVQTISSIHERRGRWVTETL